MKAPIVILAFDRPHYLKQTLLSLALQREDGILNREIHLFQDGFESQSEGNAVAEEEKCDENVRIFNYIFPGGIIHRQEKNLGIALHFDFAERFIFEEKGCDVAIFLEDDMVLSENYLSVMESLIEEALRNDKIGYVAAYGDHHAELIDQLNGADRIVGMDHKWGFALTRRQWLKQRSIVKEYLTLVSGSDYRKRDHKAIIKWMASKGLVAGGTSQDAAKDLAMYISGSAKFMTYACFGRYIGQQGVHYRKEDYDAGGYSKAAFYPNVPKFFSWPSTNEIDANVNQAISAYAHNANNIEKMFPFMKDDQSKSLAEQAIEILTGRTAPQRIRERLAQLRDPAAIRTAILNDPELFGLVPEFRLAYEIGALAEARRRGGIKLIIGAAGTAYPGWTPTNQDLFDLLQPEKWLAWVEEASIEAMLAEHVWEHLDVSEGKRAAETCFRFLATGKKLRIAVPDALFPDEDYHNYCKIGNKDGHKTFYNFKTLSEMLQSCGFETKLIEYWDESGVFHSEEWSDKDGYISRSSKNDWRNRNGELKYTSLIVDAIKS